MSEAIQMPPPFSPSESLAAAHLRLLTSRCTKKGPAANTRASSIGNECERAIFYDQVVPAEERVTHSPQLQAIFDMGRIAETHGLRVLEDMGAEIVQRERDYLDAEHRLSGHLDIKIRMPGWPRAIPCELKSANPYTAESVETLRDIKESNTAYLRRYYDQIQTYLYLTNEELGCFIIWNKSTWWPTFIDCPRDDARIKEILEKAKRIKLAVLSNTPPPRNQGTECKRCQFFSVCAPDVNFGDGVQFLDDGEVEQLLARRDELEAAAKEYDAIDRELKKHLLPEVPELVVGDFVITGKRQDRRGFEVAPSSFFKRTIRRLNK